MRQVLCVNLGRESGNKDITGDRSAPFYCLSVYLPTLVPRGKASVSQLRPIQHHPRLESARDTVTKPDAISSPLATMFLDQRHNGLMYSTRDNATILIRWQYSTLCGRSPFRAQLAPMLGSLRSRVLVGG